MNTLASSSSLVPFDFEGRQIRVFTDEQGEPWFVAADICHVLGIGNPRQAIAQVPGVKPGIAMAATLTCIQENTGLATDTLRRALPAAEEPICSLNATGLGRLLGMKAKDTNQHLAACGLQIRNPRGDWELTNAGLQWAEALPYCRGGHSGYQILWNPAVVDVVRELG